MSHLTRGAWIEIQAVYKICRQQRRRTSHEVRGLKSKRRRETQRRKGRRTSHEVRGLKYDRIRELEILLVSHLTRGAWIEITPEGAVAIEQMGRTSHEVRGLKCSSRSGDGRTVPVAPHTRCVD